ncbi:hypothetical protein I3842_04G065600 [Carya illinoinensis]|uniref:Uncharacterized protein n=2 Tax=Carya illinoinensis TaxID=32201 RepID=A0A922JQL7_CARIL|nr:hypothetical protein I3842_04G065600 [Carya illinoinensis]
MATKKSLFLFPLLIIILALTQTSSSRHIHQASDQGKEQSSRTKNSSVFFRSYSALLTCLESLKNKSSSVHTVSHRLVPVGPNPLHNIFSFLLRSRVSPKVDSF